MPSPTDYWSQLNQVDVGDMVAKGIAQNQQDRAAQALLQRTQAQQAQLDAARAKAIANPSAANYNALLLLDPKSHEGIKAASDAWTADERNQNLQEITAIDGLLASGRADAAAARVQRILDAHAKAGFDPATNPHAVIDQDLLEAIKADPKAARLYTGSLLTGVLGADKAVDAIDKIGTDRRDDAKLRSDIALTTAQAGQADAAAGLSTAQAAEVPANAESQRQLQTAQAQQLVDSTALAADRLGLDRDRLTADIDARLKALDIQQGTLSPQATTAVNNAVISGQASRGMATRAGGLADAIQAESHFSGGWAGGLVSALTAITGDASTATQLRRQYTELRNSSAVKNLPPGPASDKDIALALKGMPPPNANRDTLVSWLRGVEKLNSFVADQQDREADWMAGNGGSLGPAKRTFFVGNTLIQPGAKFDDIQKAARREAAQAAAAARVGAQ